MICRRSPFCGGRRPPVGKVLRCCDLSGQRPFLPAVRQARNYGDRAIAAVEVVPIVPAVTLRAPVHVAVVPAPPAAVGPEVVVLAVEELLVLVALEVVVRLLELMMHILVVAILPGLAVGVLDVMVGPVAVTGRLEASAGFTRRGTAA